MLDENPYLSNEEIATKLRKETDFGNTAYQTIKNSKTKWKQQYSKNRLVPRALHAGCGRLDSGFSEDLWMVAPVLEVGWSVSKGKNRMRLWSGNRFLDGVSLQWHRTGTVMFHFKGPKSTVGLLKGAFVKAFLPVLLSKGANESDVLNRLETLFDEKYQTQGFHYAYDFGVDFPKFRIRDFVPSHGIEVLCDGSHRGPEINVTTPYWISKLDESAEKISHAADSFAENMKAHVDLVKTFEKESVMRQKLLERSTSPLPVEDFDRRIRNVESIPLPYPGWCSRCGRNNVLFFNVYCVDSRGQCSMGAICRDCVRVLREKAPARLRKILWGPLAQRKLRRCADE